ncbi:MAG TPA: DinB family protein [Gemmatimonadaceae bacterium]|nr:DinB family protein [Gemmatimonadaceae bacterium]
MSYLTSDIRSIVSGDAWHGPSWRDVLAGVDARQAATRIVPAAHTIYELVHHTAAWAAEVGLRLGGATAKMPVEGDFPPNDAPVDAASWQGITARLVEAHDTVIAAIEGFDPARLDDRVGTERDAPLGSGVSYRAMIAGLLAHTAYHAGQAMLLRRALEAEAKR